MVALNQTVFANLFIQIICEWCVLSCRDETSYVLEIEALDEGPTLDVEDEIYGEGDIQNKLVVPTPLLLLY